MRPVSSSLAFSVAAMGIATYSAMDVLMKGLSITSGAYSAVLWRSFVGVMLLGTVFLLKRRAFPGRAALKLHALRGATGGISVLLFFWGLVRVPMAQGVALTFLAPLIALFFAAVLLGETIRRAAILGSVIASLGVLAIAAGEVQAHASTAHVLGSLAIFAASIFYAYSLILLRQQAQVADPLEVALFTSIVLTGLLLVGAWWFAAVPSVAQLSAIGGAAVLGSISAIALAWAYSHAEAQVLAPVEYTAFVWAGMFGWWVFDERVSAYTVAGAALIIAGCVFAIRGTAARAPQTEAAA
ncbi:DMT family transporter [Sphingomonas sp. TREG-RG-20F-R18-01]|uniref:DMT family transporter n=1 Tax=Sphingomonas sp. TREG-RG-20F-R18-01 TaxID=2914982 RepID=UPI001F59BCCE|nr:DMT family transporter [Sphingomonas sp. TREG-RG-20F-R18-01]